MIGGAPHIFIGGGGVALWWASTVSNRIRDHWKKCTRYTGVFSVFTRSATSPVISAGPPAPKS